MSGKAVVNIEATLAEAVIQLREAFAPIAIYLFGSFAHGAPGPGSDLDLLVVVEDDPRDVYERDAAAYAALGNVGMPKDVLVYTREEFERRSALPVSFERTVRTKGKLIYAA